MKKLFLVTFTSFCRQSLGPRLVTDYLSLSNHLMM